MTKLTHVAVAVLQDSSGNFLLASRPTGKPWAGWWEFPGGKIEANETPALALTRELQEELGITPTQIQPWIIRRYDYPATHDSEVKTVLLHFYFVTKWQGEITAHEGQQLAWQNPQEISVSPVLPANVPILKALALPPIYAISNMAELGEAAFLSALKNQLKQGLKLIQIREKQLNEADLMVLICQILSLAKPFDAKVLVNDNLNLALKLGADGVHLTGISLQQLTEKPANLPDNFLLAASCHDANDLQKAQRLGLGFAVLSPVLPTKSHPDALTLGWETFTAMVKNLEIPVYALGGMTKDDMPKIGISKALSCGARGVAMQRDIWNTNV